MGGRRKTRWKKVPLGELIGDDPGYGKGSRLRHETSDQSEPSNGCPEKNGYQLATDNTSDATDNDRLSPEMVARCAPYLQVDQASDRQEHSGCYINGLWIPNTEMLKHAQFQLTPYAQYPVLPSPNFRLAPYPRFRPLNYPLELPLFPNYFIPSSSHYFFYLTRHREIPSSQRPYKRSLFHHPRCPYWNAMHAPYDVATTGRQDPTAATAAGMSPLERAPPPPPSEDQMTMRTLPTYVYPGYTFGPPGFVSHVPQSAPPFRPPPVQQQPQPLQSVQDEAVIESSRQRKRKKKRRALLEAENDAPEDSQNSSPQDGATPIGSTVPVDEFLQASLVTSPSGESPEDVHTPPLQDIEQFAKELIDRIFLQLQAELIDTMNGYKHLVEEEDVSSPINGYICQPLPGSLPKGLSDWEQSSLSNTRHEVQVIDDHPAVHANAQQRSEVTREDNGDQLKQTSTDGATTFTPQNNNSRSESIEREIGNGQRHLENNECITPRKNSENKELERKLPSPAGEENGNEDPASDVGDESGSCRSEKVVTDFSVDDSVAMKNQAGEPVEVHVFGRPFVSGSERTTGDQTTTTLAHSFSTEMRSPLDWQKEGVPRKDCCAVDSVKEQADVEKGSTNEEDDELISEITKELSSSEKEWTKQGEEDMENKEKSLDDSSMVCFGRSSEAFAKRSDPSKEDSGLDIPTTAPEGPRNKSTDFSRDSIADEGVPVARSASSAGSLQILDKHYVDEDGQRTAAAEEPSSSFSYLSYLASSEALLRETELELNKLKARSSLQANQSIYKLAYDETITDPSDTEEEAATVAPSVADKENQPVAGKPPTENMDGGGGTRIPPPVGRNYSEIVVHEADDVSEAGSEDVELLPHRYESEATSADKHLYFNRLSLAAELLRTKEQLPYDSDFKRVVALVDDDPSRQGGHACVSEQPTSIGADNPAFVGDPPFPASNRISAADSGIHSEISEHEVAEEAREDCGKIPGLEEDQETWTTQSDASQYRWFGAQTRRKLTFIPPRGGPVPPCFCCIIM